MYIIDLFFALAFGINNINKVEKKNMLLGFSTLLAMLSVFYVVPFIFIVLNYSSEFFYVKSSILFVALFFLIYLLTYKLIYTIIKTRYENIMQIKQKIPISLSIIFLFTYFVVGILFFSYNLRYIAGPINFIP